MTIFWSLWKQPKNSWDRIFKEKPSALKKISILSVKKTPFGQKFFFARTLLCKLYKIFMQIDQQSPRFSCYFEMWSIPRLLVYANLSDSDYLTFFILIFIFFCVEGRGLAYSS
jgi:hypothetical protein